MTGSDARMQAVLDGYATLLREKDLALPKHQPCLVRWVREFLFFAHDHSGHSRTWAVASATGLLLPRTEPCATISALPAADNPAPEPTARVERARILTSAPSTSRSASALMRPRARRSRFLAFIGLSGLLLRHAQLEPRSMTSALSGS